jgi:hypothetical protein
MGDEPPSSLEAPRLIKRSTGVDGVCSLTGCCCTMAAEGLGCGVSTGAGRVDKAGPRKQQAKETTGAGGARSGSLDSGSGSTAAGGESGESEGMGEGSIGHCGSSCFSSSTTTGPIVFFISGVGADVVGASAITALDS